MSYDLIVYRTPPGRDPEEVFEQEMEAEEVGARSEPTDDPGLDRCDAEIQQAIGDDAVTDRCCSHLTINIPYHFEGAQAQRLFSALAQCLHRACTEDGLTVYDPQDGRVLSPQRDLASMLRGNERGREIVRDVEALRGSPPERDTKDSYGFTVEEKKPWWRFW